MLELVIYSDDLKEEVFRFTAECFAELGKAFEPLGRHGFYNEIEGYFERFWCLTEGGKVAGTVAVKKIDDTTCELKALYVDSSLRGQGLGYKLLDAAVSFAREKSFSRIVLDSMSKYEAAAKLYRHYGFTDTARYNDNVYADVFMEMKL